VSSQGNILKGKFIERPNRFLAKVDIKGRIVESFVPNPGRMLEFMVPGKVIYLRENSAEHRRTEYDMIGVLHDGIQVSIDSNLPNRFVRSLLEKHSLPFFSPYEKVIPEPRHFQGRFDFRLEGEDNTTLIEVKSCTLVEDGQALFPDAPTLRGTRHMKDLVRALEDGVATKAAVIFVVQRHDAMSFAPHDGNDPDFGSALRAAHDSGVDIIPIVTRVINWNLHLQRRIPFIRGPLNFKN